MDINRYQSHTGKRTSLNLDLLEELRFLNCCMKSGRRVVISFPLTKNKDYVQFTLIAVFCGDYPEISIIQSGWISECPSICPLRSW